MYTLENLIEMYKEGIITEFTFGMHLDSTLINDNFNKMKVYKYITEYFSATPEQRIPEYIDNGIRYGIPKETWEYIVSIGLEK